MRKLILIGLAIAACWFASRRPTRLSCAFRKPR